MRRVDGSDQEILAAPAGWSFRTRAWSWEDGEHLVAPVVRDDGRERVARCRVQPVECVLVARG